MATQKIAVPVADGTLAAHFGHCEKFAIFTVEDGTITGQVETTPPAHEPGVLPRWLAEQGANVILAGGMGQRAQNLFTESGVQVCVGAPREAPEKVVRDYVSGSLELSGNLCDH